MNKSFGLAVAIVTMACSGFLLAQQPASEAQQPVPLPLPVPVEESAQAQAEVPEAPLAAKPALEAADLEDWLDGYVSAAIEQAKIAGAVVSVVKNGKLLLSKGYGQADIAAKTPMDPAGTLVRVGSTSKLFTWTAVMQLVEQGKLDLDRDVNDYLDFRIPEGPGGPVTLNDLMTHRGGFEEGLREVLITDPAMFITTEHYLKAHPRPRMFPAGAVPAYSNFGTALAGYIVERISGEPFDDYIDKHILAPLGMQHSTFRQPLPEQFQSGMSQGYTRIDEPPYAFELITTAPAGSLSSTADDMARFMIAQLNNGQFEGRQILQPDTARLMHSPSISNPEGFATMAHGFFSATENGHWVIGHGGDTIVFHTDLNLIPDEGVGIFVSFNSRGEQDAVYNVRSRMFEDFMDRYFPEPAAQLNPPADPKASTDAQSIAGSYESSRRIQSGFLALFYLLQQDKVTANGDGTISLASEPGKKFREIEPNLWRDESSAHSLHIAPVDGLMTIVDSRDPTSVRQATPAARNASLNLSILLGSLTVLLLVVIAWPIGWRYRRQYRQPQPLSGKALLAQRLTRFAALADVAYLFGWYFALLPIVQMRLEAYGPALDGLLRTLQIGALFPVAGAVVGLWNAWLTIRSDRHWVAKLGSVLLAGALVGIVWIAWAGSLISFSLEY